MGAVKVIALIVLSISFVVFVALFGRLPLFRRTPIGFLHRLIWKHIPDTFLRIDDILTGRRISRGLSRTSNYLMNEKHPVVLIFFIILQLGAEVLFVPSVWSQISTLQQIIIPIVVVLPFLTLYLSVVTTSDINEVNHHSAMVAYPYDYTLFHPGYFCSTCRRPKPARSKHCGLCKTCVQRQDHHCIWINNCVGRNNYIWFNLLLAAISVLLAYGATLGFSLLDGKLQERFVPSYLTRGSTTSKRWSTNTTWAQYLDCWLWAIGIEWRIGSVSLLALMSFPMSVGFLAYHVYLIWAGMTTNESGKWGDWREDIADGLAYRAQISELRNGYNPLPEDVEPSPDDIKWPYGRTAKWWMIRTRNGERPTIKKSSDVGADEETDERWEKVKSLKDVDNVYDLGIWRNAMDLFFYRD